MKVKELIQKLQAYYGDLEVRIMNTAIDVDESCPTFEIDDVESALDINFEVETITCKEDDFILIEYKNDLHIDNMYKFNYDPNQDDKINVPPDTGPKY